MTNYPSSSAATDAPGLNDGQRLAALCSTAKGPGSDAGEGMTQEERLAEYQRLRADGAQEAQQILAENRKRARQDYIARAYGHAGIPPRFQSKRFENYQVEANNDQQRLAFQTCQRYAGSFAEVLRHGTCLTLIGHPGTGKTHLASAIGQAVIDQGYACAFRSMSAILRDFRSSYQRDASINEIEILGQLVEPDLLIIDEIGMAIGSRDKQQATMFDVFNARYESVRPTILIGNLTREELRGYLGERVERRVQEGGGPVLACEWAPHEKPGF